MRTVGLLKNGKVAQVTEKAAKAEKPKKTAAKGKAEKPEQTEVAKDKAENAGSEDE